MTASVEKGLTIKVARINIAANLLLMVMKFVAGIAANSSAMVADAVHSASDVFGSALVIVGANISSKEADQEHPYGHERMECVISMILANILLLVALGIGLSGLEKVFESGNVSIAVPGQLALAAAVVAVLVKEGLFRYGKQAADKLNSVSLMAEAWHHRSDAMSSAGSFVGILGARMGYPILDPLASVVIAVFILKVALETYRETINRMVDRSCDGETEGAMRALIMQCDGVQKLSELRTRLFGSKLYVEAEIEADADLSLMQADAIVMQVHDSIEAAFPLVKHCEVHVKPVVDNE